MTTIKQRKAIALMMENGGIASRAMREAGYSEATAKNPDKLTKSKAFQELMDAYLPDDTLLRALAEDIEKKEQNRKAELELAFKLKGKMVDKQEMEITLPTPILSDVSKDDSSEENSSTEKED